MHKNKGPKENISKQKMKNTSEVAEMKSSKKSLLSIKDLLLLIKIALLLRNEMILNCYEL